MKKKFRILCMLTVCFLVFLTVPAFAQDSNGPKHDLETYQQLLKERTTSNQGISSQAQKVDEVRAKTLLKSIKINSSDSSSSYIYESEPNDSIYQANNIEIDQVAYGTITDVYYDLDYYELFVPEAGDLSLTGILGSSSAYTENQNFAMGLKDSYGNDLEYSQFYSSDDVYGQNLSYHVQPGTYYIDAFQLEESNYYLGENYGILATLYSDTAPDVHPTSVSLDKSNMTLVKGSAEQLTATVFPSDATNQDVTWTSSRPSVAAVDATGLVTALAAGTNVKITVSTVDGSKQAYCYVTVTAAKTVRTLSAYPSELNLIIGEIGNVALTATYSDNSTEDVTEFANWDSSTPSVATVDFDGYIAEVTALAKGATTVSGSYGGKTANVNVTVIRDPNEIPVLDHMLVKPEIVSVAYGKTQTLKIYAVYTDDSEVDVTQSVTLESDDPETATVTRGKVKGIMVGDTFLRGTYEGLDIEITVTVTPPVTKLSADPTVINLMEDGSETITLTATYKDGTEADVEGSAATWKSSKPQFATVNGDGEVTGVAIGATTITATFGGKTATINVKVLPELDHFLVQPAMVGVARGKTQLVTIYAVYVDGSKADITKTIRLTSQDTDVATVTGATIKGILSDNETVVSGTYLDQDIEIPVKVTEPLKTLKADTDASGLNLTIDGSESINLTATYADGTSEGVNDYAICVSSKPSVATVEVDGGEITVTGVAPGSTTITLTYEARKVTVKVKVTE